MGINKYDVIIYKIIDEGLNKLIENTSNELTKMREICGDLKDLEDIKSDDTEKPDRMNQLFLKYTDNVNHEIKVYKEIAELFVNLIPIFEKKSELNDDIIEEIEEIEELKELKSKFG